MKPVFLNFTDEQGKVIKTFTACSLKTGMVDNIFDLAESGDKLEKGELEISQIKDFYRDLKAIIVGVFKGQFTYDELNEGAEQEELMRVFKEICGNISGEIRKN